MKCMEQNFYIKESTQCKIKFLHYTFLTVASYVLLTEKTVVPLLFDCSFKYGVRFLKGIACLSVLTSVPNRTLLNKTVTNIFTSGSIRATSHFCTFASYAILLTFQTVFTPLQYKTERIPQTIFNFIQTSFFSDLFIVVYRIYT